MNFLLSIALYLPVTLKRLRHRVPEKFFEFYANKYNTVVYSIKVKLKIAIINIKTNRHLCIWAKANYKRTINFQKMLSNQNKPYKMNNANNITYTPNKL